MFAAIVTPTSTTIFYVDSGASRRTPGHSRKTKPSLANGKGVATSSFLKHKFSMQSKQHYNPSSQPVQRFATPRHDYHEYHHLDSRDARSSSTSSIKSYSSSSHMTFISQQEATKRPGLTKKLYLGDEDEVCALLYSTAQLEQRFPHAALISLEEAAACPELTKRILFM